MEIASNGDGIEWEMACRVGDGRLSAKRRLDEKAVSTPGTK
jgi:hypothetical protein